MDQPGAEIGDGHFFRIEARDRRGHQQADAAGPQRIEDMLIVGLDVDARGPSRAAGEPRLLLGVVEHRRPANARHRAEHEGQLLLDRYPQPFVPGGAA